MKTAFHVMVSEEFEYIWVQEGAELDHAAFLAAVYGCSMGAAVRVLAQRSLVREDGTPCPDGLIPLKINVDQPNFSLF